MKNIEITEGLALFIVTLSVLIIVGLIYYLKKKYKKQQEKLILIKRKQLELKEELNLKNRELVANSLDLTKKEQVMQSVQKKLTSVHNNLSKRGFNDIQLHDAIRELKPNISKRPDKIFEKQFIEINPNFYSQLNGRCKSLTPNERKICAFLKLNLTTKEISEITNQSPRAIEVARHRLRKKLNLSRQDNLTSFIARIS